MSVIRYLRRQPQWLITVIALIFLALLGLFDYATGPGVSFSVFYLLPISLVTWLTDRRNGLFVAMAGAATWLIADLASGTAYSQGLLPVWNAGVRLGFFVITVYLEAGLKAANEDLELRVKERTARLVGQIAERKKAEQQLQQYADRLEILHEIDRAILAAQSLEVSAQTVVDHLRELLPCQRASVSLLDFQSHHFLIFAAADAGGGRPAGERIPLDKLGDLTQILEPFRRGEVELTPDLTDSAQKSPATEDLVAQGFRSSLSAPIFAQHELIGTLNLLAREPDVFTPDHVEIAREVANQLGVAIQHASLLNQLRSSREDLQGLSQKLLGVQETERRYIARELHDEIGQALTGLRLTLEMAMRQPAEAATNNLTDAHALVLDLMERVSKLSLELRPTLLDDLGLLPTLLWHIDRYSSQTGVTVDLKHNRLEGQRFAPEVETAAYRIVQEALTNIARYAGVDAAWVTLWLDQEILGIQVEDHGHGFDPDAVLASGNSSGLVGMRERALFLGGKLTIESAPGQGTRVLAELPASGQVTLKRET